MPPVIKCGNPKHRADCIYMNSQSPFRRSLFCPKCRFPGAQPFRSFGHGAIKWTGLQLIKLTDSGAKEALSLLIRQAKDRNLEIADLSRIKAAVGQEIAGLVDFNVRDVASNRPGYGIFPFRGRLLVFSWFLRAVTEWAQAALRQFPFGIKTFTDRVGELLDDDDDDGTDEKGWENYFDGVVPPNFKGEDARFNDFFSLAEVQTENKNWEKGSGRMSQRIKKRRSAGRQKLAGAFQQQVRQAADFLIPEGPFRRRHLPFLATFLTQNANITAVEPPLDRPTPKDVTRLEVFRQHQMVALQAGRDVVGVVGKDLARVGRDSLNSSHFSFNATTGRVVPHGLETCDMWGVFHPEVLQFGTQTVSEFNRTTTLR